MSTLHRIDENLSAVQCISY